MQEKYAQIEKLLSILDELLAGKYVAAEGGIGEALKAIATSEELTKLFDAVTSKFDYRTAKAAYLKFPAEANATHGVAYLPAERGDILAFVFCVMVEINSGAIPFGDFLLRYFYVDGSYTASYIRFSERMLRPFRDIIQSCYPEASRKGRMLLRQKEEENVMRAFSEKATVEREQMQKSALQSEDAFCADTLLAELCAACGREDVAEIRALLVGYRYFLKATGIETEGSEELFSLAEKL